MNQLLVIKNGLLPADRPAKARLSVVLNVPAADCQVLAPALAQALVPLQPERPPAHLPAVQLPQPAEFSVAHETAGPMELTLPFGWQERRVNAATFKALAGRPRDNLFRQDGVVWRIVENAELIDLQDKTVVYKLGPVQIYS